MSDDDRMKGKALDRVRKMLALANNEAASEGERDNALRMAHATLAKYNLTLGDAEVKEEPRIEGSSQISPHPWARQVIAAVAQLYFCKTFFYRYRDKRQVHHFIGRESNVATAIEMCRYVVGSINKEARRKARDNWHITGYERAFCKGATAAIINRCFEIRRTAEQADKPAAGTALVLASLYRTEDEKNALVLAEKHGELKVINAKQHRPDADAWHAGKSYGAGLNLNHQVSGSSSTAARLK